MSRQATCRSEGGNEGSQGRVRYARDESEPPSVAVAIALARYNGEDVVDASVRLYDHVDPDALDAIFADRHDGGTRSAGTVRFTVDETTVVVRHESIEVYPDA